MKFRYIVIVGFIMGLGHFGALKLGLYQGKIWVDMPLHFLGGIFLAMIWWWLTCVLRTKMEDKTVVLTSFLGFVSIGSTIWELYEYGLWYYYTEIAKNLKLYSPEVSDVLSDMTLALLGGIFIAILYMRRIKVVEEING